jgi:hypothetical protein
MGSVRLGSQFLSQRGAWFQVAETRKGRRGGIAECTEGSEGAERGLLSTDSQNGLGGNGDRGKREGAEGAESLNALRGVRALKEASVDARIDGLMYELYGVTEEVGVVEGRLKHE